MSIRCNINPDQTSAARRLSLSAVVALILILNAGCGADTTTRRTLYVDGVAVTAEIADTPALRGSGLMHRTSLADNEGMLFVYPEPGPLMFWMKNTPLDLDIGFFGADLRLINIEQMRAFDQNTLHRARTPAQYALEMKRGWFARHAIVPGALLQLNSDGQ